MATRSSYSQIFFGLSFVLILYLFYMMLRPFLISVILSLTLVSLFYPNYQQLNRKVRGRSGLSAILMCTIITILLIIPSFLFSIALFNELNQAYGSFQAEMPADWLEQALPWQTNPLIREFWSGLHQYLGVEEESIGAALSSLASRAVGFFLEHYSIILSGIGAFLLNFFIMVFSMFFFFRDGSRFLAELKRLVPLAPHYEDMLVTKLRNVVYATFFGIFATAICQGLAGGIIFFILGISNPILWGTATAIFSLVPVMGTATVWVPMAVYLILTGSVTKGIVLLILGSTVIGLVDNFVRPLIIEGRSDGMHLLLVFFALLGGLVLFGPAGLVLGPLITALLVAFLDIYKIEFREDLI
jgi:predicted PurR-regulated permease PerM